jgi:exodeoxyribonuclease VII large subunit
LAVPDQDALRQTLDGYAAAFANAMQNCISHGRKHLKVLSESAALQSPDGYLQQRKKALEMLQNRLISAQLQQNNRKNQRFIGLTAKLDAMSPLKVLSRGYAMVQQEDGGIIRQISDVKVQDRVCVSLADGRFTAIVEQKKERNI